MEKKFRTLSAYLRRGRLSILFALLFALQTGYGTPAAAQDTAAGISGQTCSATASGKVTDETGTPVSGVVVSDGRNCVATDKKGRYTLRCDPSATHLFISVPAGYETTGQQGFGSYPDFYVPIEPAAGKPGKLRADFRLRTVPQSQQNFTLLLVGDPQSDSDQQIVRYERETIADMKRTLGQAGTYAVAIALGDVVGRGDGQSHLKHKRVMGTLGVPYYATAGNHDKDAMDYSGETFSKALGPRWYSFNVGDVHFVCMDNVDSFEEQKKGAKYHAGFSDIQLQWLRQDLAFVGKDKMIFLYYHIPERDHTSHRNHDAVFSLIAPYENTVTACGHTHFFQPYMETEYGTSEYIMGAACGYFWRSHCAGDGVPNGYSVMTVSGTEITDAYFKGTGHSRDYQLRLYRGDDIFGSERASYTYGMGSDVILANVFFAGMGGKWKIEVFEDGELSGEMEKMDPSIGDLWIRGYHTGVKSFPKKSASAPCHHLFSYKLKNPDAKVVVRATDPFGNTYTQNRITRAGDYGDATGAFLQCPAD